MVPQELRITIAKDRIKNGTKVSELAFKYGYSEATVRNIIKEFKDRDLSQTGPDFHFSRWNSAEIKALKEMSKSGKSNGEIAVALGRSVSSVSTRKSVEGLSRSRKTGYRIITKDPVQKEEVNAQLDTIIDRLVRLAKDARSQGIKISYELEII